MSIPAIVATQSKPHVSAYYQKLIAQGKKAMQVIVPVMRKLLLTIWGMFKNNESWDGNRFYKMA